MTHPVIPPPVRFDTNDGHFRLRPGTRIACTTNDAVPIAERFCAEMRRRCGLHLVVTGGDVGSDEPGVRIEVAAGDKLGVLRAPQGVSPSADGAPDERYMLSIGSNGAVLRAAEAVGVARGLTTLTQLLSAAPPIDSGTMSVPSAHIFDYPRYAWRGLSLDLARTFLAPDEVRRVIDLLALYKLNVLHLHLTDDQAWRLPVGRSPDSARAEAGFYSVEDLRSLVAYAEDRFVTLVPEVDTPGHASALVQMHPELDTGRNQFEFELPPGHKQRGVWLDPGLPATFELVEDVLAGVASMFPSPYIHIGGDEPWGMPHDLYSSYVRRVREFVRSIGKRPLGWQESARAGLGRDDIIQYWFTDIALAASLPPEVRAQMDTHLAMSRKEVETAVAASVPVIVSPLSHCYLDVPYAEPSADPKQAERQDRVGFRLYSPVTVAESFDWEPSEGLGAGRAAQVAGVEAAIWCETISDFDDVTFLLLPRLAGVAHKAWSEPQSSTWLDHRDRLARHVPLWAQDDLCYFRTSAVEWK